MIRSDDITSFTDYRGRLREHHDRVRATNRPLFITRNGETEAVVLSPEAYDRYAAYVERQDLIEEIKQAEKDFAAGKGVDALE
ncbi:type II toxin-antitoxin system Phd/YefM family antitoxin [Mucisphaera calidilacus]|uniref:Antitoxin n=1 Tax=Mucisphaera calidilacus TaxID=2527982 RepID=A0A518BYU4_9BACT|nr:type II toxin-antitoxin system Phd/YefM family antitoxin [Mucisphaera calidilacus]QDU72147.1 Phd_YefM [Mucisphaera calidilacus]